MTFLLSTGDSVHDILMHQVLNHICKITFTFNIDTTLAVESSDKRSLQWSKKKKSKEFCGLIYISYVTMERKRKPFCSIHKSLLM